MLLRPHTDSLCTISTSTNLSRSILTRLLGFLLPSHTRLRQSGSTISMDPPPPPAAAAAEAEATVGAQPLPARSPGKGTTLLDVYEVEWITRELERLLVRESGCRGGGRAGDDGHRRRKGTTKAAAGSYTRPATDKGGFLIELLGRHAVSICGETAAGTAVVSGGRAPRGRGSFREVEKV